MLRDVQDEAGFSHRRPRRDQDQVRRLKSRRHLIEIDEAGRDAGDEPLVLLQLFDRREAALDQVAQRHEASADAVLGNGKDGAFGAVEEEIRFLFRLVGIGQYLVG